VEYDDDMYKIHIKVENFLSDEHDNMYKIHVKVGSFQSDDKFSNITEFFSRVQYRYDENINKIHVKVESFHLDGHFDNIYGILS
jgi:hypothetical protein